MNEPKTAQDPSMEEILASIRRIIAEGEEADKKAQEEGAEEEKAEEDAAAANEAATDDNVLDLVDIVDEAPAEEIEVDLVEDDTPPAETPAEEPAPMEEGLVSAEPATETGDAFADLARSIAAADSPGPDDSPRLSSGYDRTLEDIVHVVLHPLLKDWLDKNLPSLVHHLVKKEIERLARR